MHNKAFKSDSQRLAVSLRSSIAKRRSHLNAALGNRMAHYKEVDQRSTALRVVCTATTNALLELSEFSEKGIVDGITANEYATYLEGAALVACQAYAVGTVADINEIRKDFGMKPVKKLACYKSGASESYQYTLVELVNSLANYFKHSEEWDGWPVNETTKTLRYYGIDEATEFPLSKGVEILLYRGRDLRGIAEILENWRFGEIEKVMSNA